MLPVADYLYRSGKGVFYPPKTTKGKKKEGKCGEKGKKCGKKKGKKTKGGKKKDRKKRAKRERRKEREKEGQKTTKSEMEKVISSPNSGLSVRFSSYKKVPPT